MDKVTASLMRDMIEYDKGDPKRIQHFVKVHDFAATIAQLENVDPSTLFVLEAAAILHDIGIHVSEEKYGSCIGKYQELEGPAEADVLLRRNGGYDEEQIERIKYLISRHHTYKDIDGMDYQILVEADFLVNLYEDGCDAQTAINVRKRIFKTKAGTELLNDMFSI